MNYCLFCDEIISKKKAYIIAENMGGIAVLDKFPVSDGHALLITKKHFTNINKVDQKSWKYLLSLMKKVIRKLEKVKLPTLPQGFNIISNMNEIAYQSVPHLHIHVIPKYEKNEGFIWNSNPKLKYSLDQVAEELKLFNNQTLKS
jgi:histidine triad (HIT) family protein